MLIGIILIVSCILRVIYIVQPAVMWWDAGIYIGMAKFIYSGGLIGVWEPFRPILWPLFLGLVWKIGLNPLWIGKIVQVVLSTWTVYLVYKIGESFKKYAGIYAAAILAFTPVYFAFTNVPLSDIPSAFFCVAALYLFLKDRFFFAGLAAGAAFLMRFPQALILVPIGLTIIIANTAQIKKTILEGIKVAAGFAIFAIPFFIFNYIRYGDALLPIRWAEKAANNQLYQNHDYLFYIAGLVAENPFFIFAGIALFLFVYSFKTAIKNKTFTVTLLSLFVIAGYLSSFPHMELRYSISFLPYLAILAGFGIVAIIPAFKKNYASYVVTSVISLSLIIIAFYLAHDYWPRYKMTPEQRHYYSYLTGSPAVITGNPQLTAYSDVQIVELFDTWETALDVYTRQKTNVEFMALDTCSLVCKNPETCSETEKTLWNAITADKKPIVFQETIGFCRYTIFKLR